MAIDQSLSPKELYERDGFVILPSLIPSSQSAALHAASQRVIDKTRSGEWKYRRTVGSQFPPYKDPAPGEEVDIWGVQHVLHPDLGEDSKTFLKWYCGDELGGVAKDLLGCKDDDLQMELFNILVNPNSQSFALRWHRDDVKGTATEEEERKALDVTHYGIQWNTALYDDECLYVVPGSHKTVRTPEQRQHSIGSEAPKNPLDMPGSIQVRLKPGETVIYNQNILHCASYTHTSPRVTLHACIGNAAQGGGQTRARNIIQHGVGWMKDDKRFRKNVGDVGGKAVGMWENTVRLGGEGMAGTRGGEVAYSQD